MGQLKQPKPKAVFMDLAGTAIRNGFTSKMLKPYILENVKTFVEENWADKELKKCIDSMRKESAKDESGPKIAAAEAPAGEQQQSVVDYVTQCADSTESSSLARFRYLLWFDGFDRGEIVTPIYSDVGIQVRKWKDMDIKIYVVSNTWVEGTKKFLSKTSMGDLNLMIDGHYDYSVGSPTAAETYTKLIGKIGQTAGDVLFLTKYPPRAKAAKDAGLKIVLVLSHRWEITKLTEEEKAYPRIRSMNELEFIESEGISVEADAEEDREKSHDSLQERQQGQQGQQPPQ
jgi:enolase-phosphatase E1